jgi:hypothetical protein
MTPRYMPSVSCRCRFLWFWYRLYRPSLAINPRGPFATRSIRPLFVGLCRIATALETALDARRQRIIISESQVNLLKWACLFMQAVCALVAIAMVHSDNRLASIIAMGIFATGVAASILLILAHDRPFTGEISIKPDPLLQVMPEAASLLMICAQVIARSSCDTVGAMVCYGAKRPMRWLSSMAGSDAALARRAGGENGVDAPH